MLFRRTYGVAILVGLILGALVTIQVLSMLDVGGVSKIVRPERGTGTRCAEGDLDACRDFCVQFSKVSTTRCVTELTRVLPVEERASVPFPDQGGGLQPGNGQPAGPPPGGPPPRPGPDPPGPPEPPPPPDVCVRNPLLPICLDLP